MPQLLEHVGLRPKLGWDREPHLDSFGHDAVTPTADLLTQRLQVHEKTAWILRAVLQ